MSYTSLTSAIRTPKVTTGLAGNVQSERSLNQDYIINPPRYMEDKYGRGVSSLDTIKSLTVGHDPEYRIVVENSLRPQYSEYLDVQQGLSGVVEDDYLIPKKDFSSAEQDTMGMRRYEALGYAPNYKVDAPMRPAFSSMSPEDQEFIAEQERVNRIIDRVYATPRYSRNI